MPRLLVLIAGLVALGNRTPAQPPFDFERMTVQERGNVVLGALKAATEALTVVKNEPSADAAKKKLNAAESLLRQTPWIKDVMTGEETKWVSTVFEPKRRQAEFELEKAQDKLLETDVKLFALVDNADAFKEMRSTKIKRAELGAQNLQKGCKVYFVLNDEKWPAKLNLLVGADGNKPVVEGGEGALRDPWGSEYKLTVVKDAAGDEVPVISTHSPYGDGKREIRWPKKEK